MTNKPRYRYDWKSEDWVSLHPFDLTFWNTKYTGDQVKRIVEEIERMGSDGPNHAICLDGDHLYVNP